MPRIEIHPTCFGTWITINRRQGNIFERTRTRVISFSKNGDNKSEERVRDILRGVIGRRIYTVVANLIESPRFNEIMQD